MQKATLEKWVDELQAQIDALKKQIGGASKLDDLTDVDITEPANGNVIAYDGSAEKWVNAALPDYALDDLTDVEITEPANGNVIAYDGTTESWINTALSHYTLTELYKSSTDLATYSTSGIELLHDIEDYDRVLFILGFTSGTDLSKTFVEYDATTFADLTAYSSSAASTSHVLMMLWSNQGFSAGWDGENKKVMMWGQNGTAGIYAVYGIKY